ncbi:MAG: NADPH-dependent 7-cyano-7-deazaguanine reductase QueF [Pseudomonadales bacterium]
MTLDFSQLPLGKHTTYSDHYDPSLLVAVPRQAARDFWPTDQALPFVGEDSWTGYEISWLDQQGKPQAGCILLNYGAQTPNIVESKSLKLYLNSFNQTTLPDQHTLIKKITVDVANIVGGEVQVDFCSAQGDSRLQIQAWTDRCIDDSNIAIDNYEITSALLTCDASNTIEQTLVSHLLRSNCPVTGQPDWASVRIVYRGAAINEENLLRYLCSFRLHQGFHEQCVERIFCDLWTHCQPETLSVEGRFTRRGGLDINPFRASHADLKPTRARQWRQ